MDSMREVGVVVGPADGEAAAAGGSRTMADRQSIEHEEDMTCQVEIGRVPQEWAR